MSPSDDIPAHNLPAERCALGAAIIEPRSAEILFESLAEDHFYDPWTREVFKISRKVFEKDGDVDLAVAGTEYRKSHSEMSQFEAQEKIGRLMEECVVASNVEKYVRLLREALAQRQLSDVGMKLSLIGAGKEPLEGVDDLMEQVENSREKDADEYPEDLADIADPIAARAIRGESQMQGLCSGVAEGVVDGLMRGLRPRRFVVLAARTHIGKSTFVISLATGCRKLNPDAGLPLIISTEMHKEEIATAALGSAAGVDTAGILDANLSEWQNKGLRRTAEDRVLGGVRVHFCGNGSVTTIRSVAKRHKARYGLPLLVIDLASKLKAPGQTIREKHTAISAALFRLRAELNCCIVACVQLNRSSVSEGRNTRPQPHNIKESGSWEEDCDQLIMLHRPGYFSAVDGWKQYATEVIQWKDRGTANVESVWIEWKKATGQYARVERD